LLQSLNLGRKMALAAEVPEFQNAEDGALKVRAPLSGWLLKRKSSKAVSRVISSTNRRYFTLDFDTQVFYYSHAENSKNVSQPVAFRHLLSVEALSLGSAEADEVSAAPTPQRQGSKNSVGSGISRLGKILSRRPSGAEEFGFTLHLAGRDMELMCATQEEADTWIDAIKEAIAYGSSEKHRSSSVPDDARAPSTAPGSSENSPPSPRSEVAEDSDDEEVPLAGTLVVGSKTPEEAAPEEPGNFAQVATETTAPAQVFQVGEGEVVVAAEEAPVALEAAVDEEAPAAEEMPAAEQTSAPAEAAAQENDAVQLGAEAAKPSPAASEVEEVVAMDSARKVATSNATAWDINDGSAPQKSASARYADKGEGLTLAQRLSQLDFSDDEDEEKGNKQSARDEVAHIGTHPEAEGPPDGGVEEIQAFVQDADSEDD